MLELPFILAGIFDNILQNKSVVIQEYLRSLKEFTAHTDHCLELNNIAREITALESKKEKLLEHSIFYGFLYTSNIHYKMEA